MKIYTSTFVRYTSLQYIIRSIVACMRRCIKNGTWWSRGRRNKFSNAETSYAQHFKAALHDQPLSDKSKPRNCWTYVERPAQKWWLFARLKKAVVVYRFWLVFLPLDDPIFDLLNVVSSNPSEASCRPCTQQCLWEDALCRGGEGGKPWWLGVEVPSRVFLLLHRHMWDVQNTHIFDRYVVINQQIVLNCSSLANTVFS